MSPLKIEHLVKNYGPVQAVKDVSFELKEGEIFGLLGPNGAGKTTIISSIVTLEAPTSGRVEVFGKDVSLDPLYAKSKIGFVPQELINHGYFNVEEILNFYSGYFGYLKNYDRIQYLLKKLGLWEHRHKKVRQLSGGMKRRLLVAKALVNFPKLLLLDEPTAGVDIELRENLWDFVSELRREGVTVLLTTHYLEEAEALCDRVGVIHLGELKKIGQTKSLIKELTRREVYFLMKENKVLEHPMLVSQENEKKYFSIPSSMTLDGLLKELNLGLDSIHDLKIREGSLEDAFRNILEGGQA